MYEEGQSSKTIEERVVNHLGKNVHVSRRWQLSRDPEAVGTTLAYMTNAKTNPDRYHTDPDCPHFPEGSVQVFKFERADSLFGVAPCPYCVDTGIIED